jgi:hypothetical protein
MPADPRAKKLGDMSRHPVRKVCGTQPSRPRAGRLRPVPQPPRGSGNCAKCLIAPTSRFADPYYGAQKFPVVMKPSGAISCRVVFEAGRLADLRLAKPLAEIAEIAEITHPIRQSFEGNGRAAAAGRALTPRSLVHRLPGLCLSGPLRSELSARSADRGRVVPVLDRLIRGHPSLLLRRVARDNRL